MISAVKNFPSEIKHDAAFVKISCLYKAYGPCSNAVSFFNQTDNNEQITAVMSFSGGNINIWQDGADLQELKSYFDFVGVKNVFTSEETAKLLKFTPKQRCFFMYKKQKYTGEEYQVKDGDTRRVLEILKSGLAISNDDDFLSDLTYRIYHSAAGIALNRNAAGVIYNGIDIGFIAAIAVLPEQRKKGIGTALLYDLCRQSKSEDVFVCCEEKNIDFYIKNGFEILSNAGDFEV